MHPTPTQFRSVSRWLAFFPIALAALGLCRLAGAAAESSTASLDAAPFEDMVRDLILRELKEKYQDQHHWGQTKKIERARVRGKWFEPRLEKSTVEVNDGLWQRVEVTLVDPEKNFSIALGSIPLAPGSTSAFSLTLQAKIAGDARIERWRSGLKGFNANVRFDATVRVRVDTQLAVRFPKGELLSDIAIDPKVTHVQLDLVDFELRKVGVIGRDLARELSGPLKPAVDHELKRREPRIADKINAAIDKRRDRLRFSPDKYLASGWTKFAGALGGSSESHDQAKPSP